MLSVWCLKDRKEQGQYWNVSPLLGDFGEREREFLVFYRALFPLSCSPPVYLLHFFLFFSLQTCACTFAVLRAIRIIFECALFFDQLEGGCGSVTPINLINSFIKGLIEEISFIKNCGLILIIGKNMVWGRQKKGYNTSFRIWVNPWAGLWGWDEFGSQWVWVWNCIYLVLSSFTNVNIIEKTTNTPAVSYDNRLLPLILVYWWPIQHFIT